MTEGTGGRVKIPNKDYDTISLTKCTWIIWAKLVLLTVIRADVEMDYSILDPQRTAIITSWDRLILYVTSSPAVWICKRNARFQDCWQEHQSPVSMQCVSSVIATYDIGISSTTLHS